jgi:hypothetical protein
LFGQASELNRRESNFQKGLGMTAESDEKKQSHEGMPGLNLTHLQPKISSNKLN